MPIVIFARVSSNLLADIRRQNGSSRTLCPGNSKGGNSARSKIFGKSFLSDSSDLSFSLSFSSSARKQALTDSQIARVAIVPKTRQVGLSIVDSVPRCTRRHAQDARIAFRLEVY